MAKIRNVHVSGKPRRFRGDVNVNSLNVADAGLVAVPAPGLLFTVDNVENDDMWVVTQTGAGTDEIALASDIPVGTFIVFQCTDAVTITVVASSSQGINGGSDSQGIPVAAGSRVELFKATATNWTGEQVTAAGARTAPTAA